MFTGCLMMLADSKAKDTCRSILALVYLAQVYSMFFVLLHSSQSQEKVRYLFRFANCPKCRSRYLQQLIQEESYISFWSQRVFSYLSLGSLGQNQGQKKDTVVRLSVDQNPIRNSLTGQDSMGKNLVSL